MVVNEHMAIVEAMALRDEGAAIAAMEAHLNGLQLHFAVGIDAYPDYFIHDIDLEDYADI
jgi:DNA-binding GntR family transcriptional regulator